MFFINKKSGYNNLGEKSTLGRKKIIINGILDPQERIKSTKRVNYKGKYKVFWFCGIKQISNF